LIKHGSERVIDDARSHISTLKMLRNFHYIDDKGKDEGINGTSAVLVAFYCLCSNGPTVRNRSRELVELLSDVEKIRSERRKAKANKHKYTGTGNDGGLSFSTGGSRYGGFGGGDTLGGSSGGRYGDSGYGERGTCFLIFVSGYENMLKLWWPGYNNYGNGGGNSGGFKDDSRRGGFEEYNAGDDEVSAPRRSGSVSQRTARMSSTATATPPKAKEPVKEVDLLGGFEEEDAFAGSSTNTGMATNKALPSLSGLSTSAEGMSY
jgi:epsin